MLALLHHELKYYINNKIEAIYLYSYFISIVLLAPFASSANISGLQSLATLTLWVALASGVTLGASSLFRRDHTQGRLEYYQLLPFSLESVMLGKWLGFYLFLLLPLAAALPIAGLVFSLGGAELVHHMLGLAAGAAALSILSTLMAAITSGMEKAGAVLSLVILPLSIPVLIFGAQYCRDSASIWQSNLLFILGFSLLMLPIMCFAGAASIRASH